MTNAALLKCPACSGSVSSDAYACPHCGKPMRHTPINTLAKMVIGAIVGMIVIPILFWFFGFIGAAVEDASRPEPPQPGSPEWQKQQDAWAAQEQRKQEIAKQQEQNE